MTAVFLLILITGVFCLGFRFRGWLVLACVVALIYLSPMPPLVILLIGGIALFFITHH